MPPDNAAARFPWRDLLRGARWVFAAFIASRLIISAAILLSRLIMVRADWWHPGGLLSVLTQWDGDLWYLEIARNGYFYSTTQPSPMPFFPFYPILVRGMSFLFHDFRVAGVITSHLCLLAAGLCLNALINLDYRDQRVNRAAVMFLMFSPMGIFFSSTYSESTFLMLAIGSFLAARKENWLLACFLGMCLSATRQVGLLITLPLFIEYLRQTWRPGGGLRPLLHPRILLLGLVPLGLVFYMLFSYVKFQDPLAFLHAAAVWNRTLSSPWQTLSTLPTYHIFHQWLFMGALGAALALTLLGIFFRVRSSYLVFIGLLTAVYLCSATLEALPRYLSVEFPLYLILGLVAARFRWTYEPMLASSVALLILCTVLSANGYWMT